MPYQINLKASSTWATTDVHGIWYDHYNNRIWLTEYGRISVATFDGTTFTKEASLSLSAMQGVITGDGTYVYANGTSTGAGYLGAYSYDPVGKVITKVAEIDFGSYFGGLYCDSCGYIWVTSYTSQSTFKIYSFDGIQFLLRYNVVTLGTYCRTLAGNGTHVFLQDNTNFKVVTFDGYTLTTVYSGLGNLGLYTSYYYDSYLITGAAATLSKYYWNGSTLSLVGSTYNISGSTSITGIAFDGYYYYVTESGNNKLWVFTHDGNNFILVCYVPASIDTSYNGNKIAYANNYLIAVMVPAVVSAFGMDLVSRFNMSNICGTAPLSIDFTAI